MGSLVSEKLDQASGLIAESSLDAWLVFVRETGTMPDPVLPFLVETGLTWQSALILSRDGRRVAVVGNYDAEPLAASGDWHEVVPYVQSVREPLLEALERLIPANPARIGVNYSTDDVMADGLSHGMRLLLESILAATRFEGSLTSAAPLCAALRGRKTGAEVSRIRAAIESTEQLFAGIGCNASTGRTERELFDAVQADIHERGLETAWDSSGCPIVNTGPDSMQGHGVPSDRIRIAPGHILHVDLGVRQQGYCSDMQRCWYVPFPGATQAPPDALRAMQAVTGAISAGAAALRPGVRGCDVDRAAREYLVNAGYSEYLHALGHQVGRFAHDGGCILGPEWERYGETPRLPVEEGQVYTLELGVNVDGRGYLGIEEMVLVNKAGCEWLTTRQMELPPLSSPNG